MEEIALSDSVHMNSHGPIIHMLMDRITITLNVPIKALVIV